MDYVLVCMKFCHNGEPSVCVRVHNFIFLNPRYTYSIFDDLNIVLKSISNMCTGTRTVGKK